jgi:hypothetical protein
MTSEFRKGDRVKFVDLVPINLTERLVGDSGTVVVVHPNDYGQGSVTLEIKLDEGETIMGVQPNRVARQS